MCTQSTRWPSLQANLLRSTEPAAKRVRYLKGTTAYGIMFKKGKPEECIGYPNDQDDRKSTSGCISIC